MHLPQGATEWATHAATGKYFLDLQDDPSWIVRRVETVRLLDSQRIERSTTLDIDCRELEVRARAHGIIDTAVLGVPLAVLPKGLLLDIDVRDDCNHLLPVATGDRDSAVAELVMLARIDEGGLDPATLNTQIAQKLYEIASSDPSEDDIIALSDAAGGDIEIESWGLTAGLAISDGEVAQWYALFDDDLFASLVITFTLQYMLIISIRTDIHDIAVVKFRHVEVGSTTVPLGQRFGVTPFHYYVEAPAVGRSAREHFRVTAPSGIFLEDLALIDLGDDLDESREHVTPAIGTSKYQYRVTHERAIAYTRGVAEGQYAALVAMRPRVRSFVRPALFSVLASLVLLSGGLWGEFAKGVLTSKRTSIEAAVAILLVFPSLISAYIARENEHDILRHLLLVPRVGVALSAIATILAGGVVVLDMSHRAVEIWWLSAAGLSAAVALWLVAIDIAATHAFKAKRSNMARSEEERIVRF